MLKYTYLIINFSTILFPVALSFDKRVQFYKSWKYVWPGMAITGLIFLGWDVFFTVKGIWSFNAAYIIGLNILGLPIEEVLFFLTVPFACIFIYACSNYYLKQDFSNKVTSVISNLLIVFSGCIIIDFYNKLYTVTTFGVLIALVILAQYVFKLTWLGRFYKAYLIILIPFYGINSILTSLPVVIYNNAQNMDQRIGTVPIEDHFYCMALLLMNIGFFEYFRRKNQTTA